MSLNSQKLSNFTDEKLDSFGGEKFNQVSDKRGFEEIITAKRRDSRICVVKIVHAFETKRIYWFNKMNDNKQDSLFNESELLKNSMFDSYQSIMIFNGESQKDSSRSKLDLKYIENVCEAVMLNLEAIDKNISSFLKNKWNINNIDAIMKSICRCASAECILNRQEIIAEKHQVTSENVESKNRDIVKIVTSEYTNTASHFFPAQNGRIGFVNAMVDKITKSYKLNA